MAGPDAFETQALGPRRERGLTPPPVSESRGGTGATTVGSPIEALERDEILRTRRFCMIAFAICGAGGLAVILLPGDPTAGFALLSALGCAIAAIMFLVRRTSDPISFRKPSTTLGWFIPASCVTTAIPYFGVFSPAPVVLVLGIYFTGLGKSTRLAYAVYTVCAGMQGLFAILVITRTTRDTGLVQITQLDTLEQVIVQGLVQIVLLATLVTARMSRRTALDAMGELERAVRLAAHREALLLEAREELERALRSGRGRFTNQTLGHYELGQVIGHGAMGEVYAATDVNTGAKVAIKLLSQASLGNTNHVLRFMRELRTAIEVKSPHVVSVLEVGEQPVPYLVMELLDGQTLGDILRDRKMLAPAEVVDIVQQIGVGITAAAAVGVVHRDLKPQNLFRHHGIWKILDFGVARAIDASDTLTAGHVVGTPSYMAPEQAAGGTVDHCTDLYAVAAIAYRALTGYPPYVGGEIAETLYRVVNTRPRAPVMIAPHLPADVDHVLAIGLAKDPSQRFASASQFAAALSDALAGRLEPPLRARGEALIAAGAWAAVRPSTTRMRH